MRVAVKIVRPCLWQHADRGRAFPVRCVVVAFLPGSAAITGLRARGKSVALARRLQGGGYRAASWPSSGAKTTTACAVELGVA
jgi:hypothetical protein